MEYWSWYGIEIPIQMKPNSIPFQSLRFPATTHKSPHFASRLISLFLLDTSRTKLTQSRRLLPRRVQYEIIDSQQCFPQDLLGILYRGGYPLNRLPSSSTLLRPGCFIYATKQQQYEDCVCLIRSPDPHAPIFPTRPRNCPFTLITIYSYVSHYVDYSHCMQTCDRSRRVYGARDKAR